MANIFARSPYLIRIAESGQSGSKVELFLSNTSFSGTPQYTLSKLIPASNDVETLYDISPYIREYIDFIAPVSINTAVVNTTSERVNVRVIRYKLVGSTYTPLGTTDYIAFDGYTSYFDGYNHDLGILGLDQGNYYYWNNAPNGWGNIRIIGGASYTAKYTNLSTGTFTSLSISNNIYDIPKVLYANHIVGNKVEILAANGGLFATYNFYPQEECKYTPVMIDFVNKYGAWQREFFYKASTNTFSVENTEYNLMLKSKNYPFFYEVTKGQRQIFNVNGKSSIKVNTGWVDESWNEILKQIMLSEHILIDELIPAKINTKSTELFKHINTKQINYSLDFEFTYDAINSVI